MDCQIIFLFYIIGVIDIYPLEEGDAKQYKVSCSGGCGSVSLDVNLKSSPSGYGGILSLHAGQEYRVDFAEYVQAFTLICCLVTDIAFSLGLQTE